MPEEIHRCDECDFYCLDEFQEPCDSCVMGENFPNWKRVTGRSPIEIQAEVDKARFESGIQQGKHFVLGRICQMMGELFQQDVSHLSLCYTGDMESDLKKADGYSEGYKKALNDVKEKVEVIMKEVGNADIHFRL